MTTHACPTGDGAVTPCCNRTVYDLPLNDRITSNSKAVTCKRRGSFMDRRYWLTEKGWAATAGDA